MGISKRAEVMAEKAKWFSFIREDLKALQPYIDQAIDSTMCRPETFEYNQSDWFDISNAIDSEVVGKPVINTSHDGEDIVYMGMMQYLFVYFRKIFLFLAYVPREKVPLYLNTEGLRPFALWRLKQGI